MRNSISQGNGKVLDMGVAQFGNHLNLKHMTFKLRESMVVDSVVIRGDSNDRGNFVFEASDLHSNFIIRSGEGPENGTWRVVHVALTKGVTVDAQAIENCFGQKDPRCKVALVDYGMYGAAKKLFNLCVKYATTREDSRALEKGMQDLLENAGPILEVSELNLQLSDTSITRIQVLERPVDSKGQTSANTQPPAKLLMHFLVVLTFKGGPSIAVEKVKTPCCGRHVLVSRHVGPSRNTSPRTTIELTGLEVQVPVLQDLIMKHATAYHPLKANCWGFAYGFAMALVKFLLNNAAVDSADKDNLQDGLEKLEISERPMPSEVVRLTLWPIFDNKNEAIWRKWSNRVNEHVHNHQHCRFHNILGKILTMRGNIMAFSQKI